MTTLVYSLDNTDLLKFNNTQLISEVLSTLKTKYNDNFELYSNKGTKFNEMYPLSFYKDDAIFFHVKGEYTINVPFFKVSFTYENKGTSSDIRIINEKIIFKNIS